MSVLRDLYHGDTRFDFVGRRRIGFTISAILIIISITALAVRGLDLGVDFEGGSVVETENPAGASVGEVRDAVEGAGFAGARVQLTGGGEGIRVQTAELAQEREDRLAEVVAGVAGVAPEEASRTTVGPTFGEQIAQSALRALIIFLIVAALFISIRLEWEMAVAAMVALFHDLLLTAGIYSAIGFEVSPATVIAILTILGYSLYDSVVVFDKVIENVSERGDKHTISGLVNMSMNQVLMRSVNTSLTSLLPIGSLLFVGSYVLGATTLREFALALFVGVALGTYSSIFVAAPILAIWKEREEHWQQVRRRLARKGIVEDTVTTRDPVPAAQPEAPDTPTSTGAVPRPPRKRRKRR
jgi:preprotein translocase subunit SecF